MKLFCIILVLCSGLAFLRSNHMEIALERERTAHAATKMELDTWKAQAESAQLRAEALADNARACLAREARAQADASERAAIMAKVKPRIRTNVEKAQVADDETRSRVVGRLNRGL